MVGFYPAPNPPAWFDH